MSVVTTLEAVGNDVAGFLKKLVGDVQKAKAIWTAISSQQTRTLLVTLGSDAIKLVNDTAAAAESGALSLTLDESVVSDIKQLIADAKAGEGVIVSDLALLGIKL